MAQVSWGTDRNRNIPLTELTEGRAWIGEGFIILSCLAWSRPSWQRMWSSRWPLKLESKFEKSKEGNREGWNWVPQSWQAVCGVPSVFLRVSAHTPVRAENAQTRPLKDRPPKVSEDHGVDSVECPGWKLYAGSTELLTVWRYLIASGF